MADRVNATHKPPQTDNATTVQAAPETETAIPQQQDIRVQSASGQLNPAAVQYLQRTIGNANVLKLLGRGKPQPASQKQAQRRAFPPDTRIHITEHKGLPIQRKIGFEFQINGSRVEPVN